MPLTYEIAQSNVAPSLLPEGKKLSAEDYRDAYMFGTKSSRLYYGTFEENEGKLCEIWNDLLGPINLDWNDVKHVVNQAYTLMQ